jgi:uncharacterized repeat protein (TIGR03803 family)
MSEQMPILRLGARLRPFALFTLMAFFSANGPAGAATGFGTLNDFQGGSDGAAPIGSLIFDAAGALYGTTIAEGNAGCASALGISGCGTVFKLTPPATSGGAWTKSVLYNFAGGGDGAHPFAGLIFGAAGALYGTTYDGGGSGCTDGAGCGTVFKLTPPTVSGGAWTESVLYSFTGVGGDASPYAGLIFDAAGALYGTTSGENGFGNGTVFKLTPPANSDGAWTESVLHGFTGGSDGSFPMAGLLLDASGALYGTAGFGSGTACGSGNGCGAVFKLTPPTISGGAWSASTLYQFGIGSHGGNPSGGLIFDAAGALYGTTQVGDGSGCGGNGCGTVFKLTPPTISGGAWTESVLHSFTGVSGDGSNPFAGVIFDATGALYGTTAAGGNEGCTFIVNNGQSDGCGMVFKLTPPRISGGAWTESVLHRFTGGSDGSVPLAGLIFDAAGALYGTTETGGNAGCTLVVNHGEANGCGTVFKLVPDQATSDFNADGHSDILWQNTSGQAAMWEMNGTSVIGGDLVGPNPGPSWQVKGSGDFNADGYADILWQDASGQAAIWEMNGTSVIGGALVGANPGPSWHAIATGDFNGDGYADILWQNTSGEVAIWEMNGTSVIGGALVGANPGPSWHAIATGDFNGDGYADILWQNTSGEVVIWEMNGTSVIGGGSLGNPGPSWHVNATGDFNGDGYSDILLQNTSGEVQIWEMNGTDVIGSASLGNPGPSWNAIGTGDFFGNRHSGILWQNTNGEVQIWEISGTSFIGSTSLGNPGPSWHPIGK